MKIFISYSRDDFATADSLDVNLRNEGHEPFFDRQNLRGGEAFHATIRDWIAASDLFIFLVSPSSVREGHFAMTELELARERWPAPVGHVVPVMVRPTDDDLIPAYLRAVNILREGDVVATTLNHVAAIDKERRKADEEQRRIEDERQGAARRRTWLRVAAIAAAAVFVSGVWAWTRSAKPPSACYLSARFEPGGGASGFELDTAYEGETNSFLVTGDGVASIHVGPLRARDAPWSFELLSATGARIARQQVHGCPQAPVAFSLTRDLNVTLAPR